VERDLVSSVKRAIGVADDEVPADPDDLLEEIDDIDDGFGERGDLLDDAYDGADPDDVDDEELDVDEDALLEEFTREQERRWLDQPIPVLGGATPRAAAADEALRPDLLTLLAESSERGRFDTNRLRADLGLA
jgi:hypothetical protein